MKIINMHKRSDLSSENEQSLIIFHRNEVAKRIDRLKNIDNDFEPNKIYGQQFPLWLLVTYFSVINPSYLCPLTALPTTTKF